MVDKLRETCIYCKGEIAYTGLESYVKCGYCGKTFAVTKFQNEQVKLKQALAEGDAAKAALKEAEAAKQAAQQRLDTAVAALSDIDASQKRAGARLDQLFEHTQADRQTREAIEEILRGLQSGQTQQQDVLTRLINALANSQNESGDKLCILQNMAERLLNSQSDLLEKTKVQFDILMTLQGMQMEAVESQKLQTDFVTWLQSVREEDLARLYSIRDGASSLLAGQRELEERVDKLREVAEATQHSIDDFRGEYRADKAKRLENLYHQAHNFQRDRAFDRAAELYRKMLALGSVDIEVYWRLVLCHYCVEYQWDDEGRLIPTILNPDLADPEEISERRDLEDNLGEGDAFYLDELAAIDRILDRYREVRHEMDFDVFISVKQTANGLPTKDSIVGMNLYDYLTGKGLRVFNSSKTELPAGREYEPYIISALMSAKALIVVGTKPEYMNAQWVRNEWSRYQWLQRNEEAHTGKTERLLFCYLSEGMQARNIPKALNRQKEVIIDNVYAHTKLDNALAFLMPAQPKPQPDPTAMSLEDVLAQMTAWLYIGKYDKVTQRYNELVEDLQFLDQARFHLRALCAEKKVEEIDQLAELPEDITQTRLFRLARRMCRGERDVLLLDRLERVNEEKLRPKAESKTKHEPKPEPKPEPQSRDAFSDTEYLRQMLDALRRDEYDWVLRMYDRYGAREPYRYSPRFHLYALCAERRVSNIDVLANSEKPLEQEPKFLLARQVCTSNYEMSRLYAMARDNEDYINRHSKPEEMSAEAQFALGLDYEQGRNGRKKCDAEAAKWYRKAAQKGHAKAQHSLGMFCENGRGVRQDYTEAAKWYRKAAEQGNATAQYNLGGLYYDGRGVRQDYAEAIKWYRAAAKQGYAWAQYNLGVYYENGKGVQQDYSEAAKWYRAAAEQGNATAQNNLGMLCENGKGVRRDYAEAAKWYRKAAERGNDLAQNNLGKLFENGKGVRQDYLEAAKWYFKSAEQGNMSAQFNLGMLYEDGKGVRQDYTEAAKWYRKAAEQGVTSAQIHLDRLREKMKGARPSDGPGSALSIAVACSPEKAAEAKAAGANYVGGEEMLALIENGWTGFDVLIATPDMMGLVGHLARVLASIGMMPSPKAGTLTMDVGQAIRGLRSGKLKPPVRREPSKFKPEPETKPTLPSAETLTDFWQRNLPGVHKSALTGASLTPEVEKNVLKTLGITLEVGET